MLRKFIEVMILVLGMAGSMCLYAAPYKISFSGALNQIWNQGQLVVGDEVSGEVFYDTNFIDTDPAYGTGFYPGASAKIKVRDLYFELSGYMFTNSAAVFSFQSQNATLAPPEVSYLVEVGLYVPVLWGYGADLPTNDQRFSDAPEAAFNFQSIVNGMTYYDVVVATDLNYALTPVPEVEVHWYASLGIGTVLLVRLARRKLFVKQDASW